MTKQRRIRKDIQIGNLEKKTGLAPGTIRNVDGSDSRSDKQLGTLRDEYGQQAMEGMLHHTLEQRLRAALETVQSKHPMEVVQVDVKDLADWTSEPTATAQNHLKNYLHFGDADAGQLMIVSLLHGPMLVSFKRPTAEPGVVELLIGVQQGEELTGVKTKLVSFPKHP